MRHALFDDGNGTVDQGKRAVNGQTAPDKIIGLIAHSKLVAIEFAEMGLVSGSVSGRLLLIACCQSYPFSLWLGRLLAYLNTVRV